MGVVFNGGLFVACALVLSVVLPFVTMFMMPNVDTCDHHGVSKPSFTQGGRYYWIEGSKPMSTQKHVAFFDRNGDYSLTPSEMLEGLQRLNCLGMDSYACKIAAAQYVFFKGTLNKGFPTADIDARRLITSNHDWMYSHNGQFNQTKLSQWISKYDANKDDALDAEEVKTFIESLASEGKLGNMGVALVELELQMALGLGNKGVMSRILWLQFYGNHLWYTHEEILKSKCSK